MHGNLHRPYSTLYWLSSDCYALSMMHYCRVRENESVYERSVSPGQMNTKGEVFAKENSLPSPSTP